MSVAHWDDLKPRTFELGDLHGTWWDLGSAAGSTIDAGIRRADLPPGGRSTPLHVHADEEEIFYIREGSGLSIQDDRAYEVSAGDVLLHRVHEEAHTLIAGRDGMSFLTFGPNAAHNVTYLPRAGVFWLGPRWIPVDVEHPFAAEAAVGPLEPPAPTAERPATISALDAIPAQTTERGPTHHTVRNVGEALGSHSTGMRHIRIASGARSYPHHCHGAEEELFVVLSGAGELRLGDDRHPVRGGSVVARPPGTRVAHSFWAGEEELELLAWGTRVPNDIAYYPDSGKVFLRGVGVIGRLEPSDHWEGEY